ncbi:ABC transporter B member 26, chloroplastic [Datura stramonium]|uniref:ABC transporter B member 26, chloroplastic n=1 Tax=Datura stramonium TaxID=4076 RepID=A0ABS8V4E3_DATST|nr:ABC transporter B member 26, chloroplastic [Datura stramonium]
MALLLSSVQFQPRVRIVYSVQKRQNPETILCKRSQSDPKSKTQFSFSSNSINHLVRCISPLNSASIIGYSLQEYQKADSLEESEVGLREKLVKWIEFVRNVFPGGNWWRLSSEDVDVGATAKPVTVVRALHRMWELIAEDGLLIFAAFTALIVTALSEISIPHFLTASIFSAQSSSIPVFHRNVRILVVLCIISGICSGVRGCFFGLANMILVKRMREKLYSTLLLQDISFFDSETVGDLTSRLGADCQQVSRVIGNDLNLILRNVLQGTGALVYLLILSWPLGLCTLTICCALFTIMLFYGQAKVVFEAQGSGPIAKVLRHKMCGESLQLLFLVELGLDLAGRPNTAVRRAWHSARMAPGRRAWCTGLACASRRPLSWRAGAVLTCLNLALLNPIFLSLLQKL